MTLLLAVIVAQATYEERARAVDDVVVAERLRIAAEFESMKAWAWARCEYRKALRLKPDSDVKGKLGGGAALPSVNDKSVQASRCHALIAGLATIAAGKHAELAKWCWDNGRKEEARTHWEWALRYVPVHAEAITALGLVGSGASARDALWKDTPWKVALDRSDSGEPVQTESALEEAWKVKTLKRESGDLEWESLGLSDDHLKRVVRQANAVVDFMRLALRDDKMLPHAKRYVLLTDRARFETYVADFSGADESHKAVLKTSGGFYNPKRRERVHLASDKDDRHEHLALANAAKGMLQSFAGRYPAHWFMEGTANACELLFRDRCEVFSSVTTSGTGTGPEDIPNKDWRDSTKWDTQLRAAVLQGTDPSMDELVGIQLNAMKPIHAAKCASLARLLIIRYPILYRSLAASFRQQSDTPSAGVEKALGFTIEELDEFWRRWIMAQ